MHLISSNKDKLTLSKHHICTLYNIHMYIIQCVHLVIYIISLSTSYINRRKYLYHIIEK